MEQAEHVDMGELPLTTALMRALADCSTLILDHAKNVLDGSATDIEAGITALGKRSGLAFHISITLRPATAEERAEVLRVAGKTAGVA